MTTWAPKFTCVVLLSYFLLVLVLERQAVVFEYEYEYRFAEDEEART
jgi:hypothetical protein